MPRGSRIRFAHQVLILQIGVVLLVAVTGYGLAAWVLRNELRHQYGQRALTLARTVAADPGLGDIVAAGDPQHVVDPRAERFRLASHAVFVVVTDRRGIRLSHPNPARIGHEVSTDPSGPLSGHEVVNITTGTLGPTARGKVPLRDHSGAIVGEVSAGFSTADITRRTRRTLGTAAAFTSAAVLLGVVASAAVGRRLKRQTLGLEPYELAELVQEREAVLHGINEGVLAADAAQRVTACNAEAARLLGAAPAYGQPVEALPVDGRLKAVLTGPDEVRNRFVATDDRVLVVNRREVCHDGRRLGTVTTLRDRTDVESLARELDAVRTLFDALRAQRHEHAGRLHTLSGLLQLGHYEEAAEYIHALTGAPAAGEPPGSVDDPYLRAFLAAKSAVAAEKAVRLEVAGTSWVQGRILEPLDVTTVLGNLVDNAIEAARLGARRPARVEVELLGDGADLHVTVSDTGEGVPAELREAVFHNGVSTREPEAGRPRGLGLALARHAARSRGGDVTLADPAVASPAGAATDRGGMSGSGAATGAETDLVAGVNPDSADGRDVSAGGPGTRGACRPPSGARGHAGAPGHGDGTDGPRRSGMTPDEAGEFGAVFVARLPGVLR